MDEPKENKVVRLGVDLDVYFKWPTNPINGEEENSRKLVTAVLKQAAQKVEPIVRAILTELLEAQSKHYIKEQPE